MYTARPHIRDHSGQVGGKLLLHIEVPLHDVISFGVRLDKCCPQFVGWKGGNPREKRAIPGIFDRSVLEEGSCQRRQKCELIRQRQNIKHSYATSDCRLAVIEWVPGETYARFKILQRGIVEKRVP